MSDVPGFAAAVHSLASPKALPAVLDTIISGTDILARYGVDVPLKLAHFLAQTSHESGGFLIAVENLRYTTAARLTQVWPSRFPDEAAAEPYVNNPEGLGNAVYANRMGNGPTSSGDGYRYRGRGLIQITGRGNYTAVGQLTGLDLVNHPELAEGAPDCLLIAAATWKHIGASSLPADASVEAYTRKVNGGTVGLADRKARFETAEKALGLI